MSYVKLCGIYDTNGKQWPLQKNGLIYAEDCNGTVSINNPTFPLNVVCEVITYVQQSDFPSGASSSFVQASVTVPNNSVSIRQSCYNQLVATYPTLVI